MGNVIGYARVSTVDQNPQAQYDALDKRRRHAHLRRPRLRRPSRPAGARGLPRLPAIRRHPGGLAAGPARTIAHTPHRRHRPVPRPRHRVLLAHRRLRHSTSGSRLVFHVFAAVAEFEQQLIRERTMAGLEAARRSRTGGRPSVMTPRRLEAARLMRQDGHSLRDIASALDVSPSTISRHLRAAASE